MRDFRGIELMVGDQIVYAGRKGSDIWLTHGVVVQLHEEYRTLRVRPTSSEKTVTLKNLFTVVVIGR